MSFASLVIFFGLGWHCVKFSPHSFHLNLVLLRDDETIIDRAR